jgi:hypothetical protein
MTIVRPEQITREDMIGCDWDYLGDAKSQENESTEAQAICNSWLVLLFVAVVIWPVLVAEAVCRYLRRDREHN